MTTCKICHRPLKDAESIRLGIGPVCRAKNAATANLSSKAPDQWLAGYRFEDHGLVWARYDDGVLRVNVEHTLVRHSPTGLEIGYGGSGPADLALNTLYKLTGDKGFADRHYQAFKWEFIANADRRGGVIPFATLRRWVETQKEKDQRAV